MSIVYTLHDYLYEPYYRLSLTTLQEFEIPTGDEEITMPCLVGIVYSDLVTAVSRGMVEAILSRDVVFPYQREIVAKYLAGGVLGIPNAIDPSLNPKNSPILQTMNYSFENGAAIEHTKEDVKTFLFEEGLISAIVPLVLFIGRLEAVKGIHTFSEVAQFTEKLNFQFVIMGSYTSGQAEHWFQIRSLLDNYDNVLVVDDRELQEKYGVLLRAAADFVFVPSEKEAFGLVSAEACKFASIPIINDIPGLRDTITDYGGQMPWTGFLYGKSRTLEEVFKTATIVFKVMERKDKLQLYESLTSLHKDWSERDGPTDAYLQAYERAVFLHGMQKSGRSSEIWNRKVGPNMLQNPSFSEVTDTGLAEYWTPYDMGYRMHNAGHNHPPSILTVGNEHTGTCQVVDLQQKEPSQVIVSGWSLAEGVDDNSEECLLGGYSLFVDVRFQDGTEIWGENVQFTQGTHTWEKQNLLLFYGKPIDKLTVCALFRCRRGYALFDDIQVFVVQQ